MMNKIYALNNLDETVPAGYTAVLIPLPAMTQSTLHWEREKETAARYIEQGFRVVWFLDFGFFNQLQKPLYDSAQFRTLKLAVDHFAEVVEPFAEQTAGILFYKGSVDMSADYRWDDKEKENFSQWLQERSLVDIKEVQQLYCRDTVVDYLLLLAGHLTQEYPCYCFLEASEISRPVHLANLLSKERYIDLKVAVNTTLLPNEELGWGEVAGVEGYFGRLTEIPEALEPFTIGVVLPREECFSPSDYASFDSLFEMLKDHGVSYRIIAESKITEAWAGLDTLIVNTHFLSSEGKRMVQGFVAAGGIVVTEGPSLDLPDEWSIKQFFATLK